VDSSCVWWHSLTLYWLCILTRLNRQHAYLSGYSHNLSLLPCGISLHINFIANLKRSNIQFKRNIASFVKLFLLLPECKHCRGLSNLYVTCCNYFFVVFKRSELWATYQTHFVFKQRTKTCRTLYESVRLWRKIYKFRHIYITVQIILLIIT
jgi:hypothetical protein